MSHILSISRIQVLAIIALAVVAFVPALTAQAASAQISATPTTITAGQSSTLTWNCFNSVTASLDNGVGQVSNSGSMQVSPQITKTYKVTCTDSTSAAGAQVTITVDNQGCYENTESQVYAGEVFPTYSEVASKVIFDETGDTPGAYDSQNHYQQCINACAAYGNCNYKFTFDYGVNPTSEVSLTRYKCMYVDPVTGPRVPKATEMKILPPNGVVSTETNYYAIEYTTTSGGTCTVPPAPTATLTANPTTLAAAGNSTLTWSSTNADQCTGTGFSTGGATSGSVSAPLTVTKDFYVNCSNEAGMATASARVTVGSNPDLVSGNITPTTATAAVATSFSATVTNSGSATTGASFPVLFQRATSAGGANATDLGSTTTATLAASANRSVSYSATLPTAGNWYVRACADKRSGADVIGLIAEASDSNNCGAWTLITVAAGVTTYPNLAAGSVSPGTAVVGTARTFSSTVTNNGAVTTGQTTQNVFQIDNNADHTTVTATVAGSASPTLAANATSVTSANYTFSSAATYYVRACADTNTSLVGAVLESNEADNCSAWRTVTVTASASGTELSCSPSASSVAVGGTVTWSATPSTYGAFAYTWDPSEAAAQAAKPATFNRTYAAAGNYGMDATVTSTGETASCGFVTVGNPCSNPDITLTAVPDRVTSGQPTVITFSASGISGSCTLSGTGLGTQSAVTASMCNVADTTVTTPAITAQSTYTVTCTDGTTESVVVNVIPRFQEF